MQQRKSENRSTTKTSAKKDGATLRNILLFALIVVTIGAFIIVLVNPTLLELPTKRLQSKKETSEIMENMPRQARKTYIDGFRLFQQEAWKEMQHLSASNRVIAHRGASYDYPQNTLPAFENTKNYWGIETDVYPTTDERWVCLHDSNVGSYSKKNQEVMSMTLAEVQKLRIDNKNYPNLTFPTLDEFLAICKKNEVVPVIEIKSWRSDRDFKSLFDTIKRAGMEKTAMISSFHLEALQKIRTLSSDVPMMYLTKEPPQDTVAHAKKIQPVSIGIQYEQLSNELVSQAHAADMLVFAWTPTKLLNILKSKSFGIDGIITNRAMDDELRRMYFNW